MIHTEEIERLRKLHKDLEDARHRAYKKQQEIESDICKLLVEDCKYKIGDTVRVVKDNSGRHAETIGIVARVRGFSTIILSKPATIKLDWFHPEWGYAFSFEEDELELVSKVK